MGSDEGYQTKIRFPETMPPFSSDNPIQALYLKKKGVERLLARYVGSTINANFARKTKQKIETESMLIDRRGFDARKDHFEDHDFLPMVLETIPSFDEDDEHRHEISEKSQEFSHYDSDEDSDWSLPGVEGRATDIRYIYGGDFCDSERRERTIALRKKEQRESSESINTIQSITSHLICNCI